MTENTRQDHIMGRWHAYINGVVPFDLNETLIMGRQKEFEALYYTLEQMEFYNLCAFRMIEGDYGTGKTAILTAFENACIEEGYIVSRFALGPHNNLSKPEIFYKDIMSHLKNRVGEHVSDFEDIFNTWLKTIKGSDNQTQATKQIYAVIQQLQEYHPSFAGVLLSYIRGVINRDIEITDIASAWIKGDYNIPYQQKKKLNIKGNIDRHNAFDILKGISKLFQLIGYKGLIICVDELEWIMNERSDIRIKSYTTLRQLIDEIGNNSWTRTFFLGAHTPDIMEDEDKGFKSYMALYQRLNSGFDDKGKTKSYKHLTILPLKPLDDKEYLKIGLQIGQSQAIEVDPETIGSLALTECKRLEYKDNTKITPRQYIKTYIHFMEMAKTNPGMPIFKVKTQRTSEE